MKTKYQLLLIPTILGLTFSGCATTDLKTYATPANARTATTIVCSNAIQFGTTEQERAATANHVYAIAHVIRTLSGGRVPTQEEMKSAIDAATPNGSKYVALATNISSIWGAFYPQLATSGNAKLALEYLEAVAAGCEDASAPFIPKP